MNYRHRQPAFTLIELLASIGIIAVLSALLVAGAGKAKQTGNRAAAAAGLRSIATGVLSCTQDNDGLVPDFYGGQNPGYRSSDGDYLRRMPSRLWPYISSPEPSNSYNYAKAFMPPAYKQQYKGAATSGLGVTYVVYNPNVKDADGIAVNVANKPLSSVNLPSKNWLVVEVDQNIYDVAPSVMGGKPGWISNVSKQALSYPMRGVAYWDGRVEMTPASKTFSSQ